MASRKTPRAVELLERHARPKEKEIAKGLLWRAKAIEQAVKRLAPAVKQGFATGQLPPELTEAIEDIERTYIAKWLAPMWRECFLNAKKDIATEVARASGKKAWGESWDVDFPELSQAAADFIARQTGVRVTNISATVRAAWQRELAQIIGEHVIEKPSSPATTAREVYGHLNTLANAMTHPQMQYYNKHAKANLDAVQRGEMTLLEAQTDAKARKEAMQRYRAIAIARTETAFAYNAGQLNGILEAQQEGKLAYEVNKIWSAAPGCCDECQALDGSTRKLESHWKAKDGSKVMMPPLHPHCRCSMDFEFDESKPILTEQELASQAAAAPAGEAPPQAESLEARMAKTYKAGKFAAFEEGQFNMTNKNDVGFKFKWKDLTPAQQKAVVERFYKIYEDFAKKGSKINLSKGHKNKELAQMTALQGWFDAEPSVVSKEEINKMIESGSREMFRGTGGDLRAGSRAEDFVKDFKTHKEYFIGTGIYGDGIYCASSGLRPTTLESNTAADLAESYAGYNAKGVVRMALKPSAKLISYEALETMATEAYIAMRDEESAAKLLGVTEQQALNAYLVIAKEGQATSVPALAIALGYDGITVSRQQGAGCAEYVVLYNRSAVAIQKDGYGR